jgi:protein-tyrosine kinase
MSLIEQAAQRLEQLRKAGKQVAGDLAYPQTGGLIEPKLGKTSTIERIADELEKRQVPSSESAAARLRRAPPSVSLPAKEDSAESYSNSGRREPVLKPITAAASAAQLVRKLPQLPASGGSRSKAVDIDMARLAAHGLLTPDASHSRIANELRVIKRPLINNCLGKSRGPVKNANRIMITSALPGEGKSFLSANLAMSIAMERDSTVLLVEADPTRPSLAQLFGISADPGLMDLLVEPGLDVADVLVKINIGRFSFIPAGARHDHATEFLASETMEKLLDHLASRYADRVLIFDSPPLLAAPEARVLARYMGQIVLVVEAEKTTHDTVQQALASVESCPMVMLALNKASAREEKAYYYSG